MRIEDAFSCHEDRGMAEAGLASFGKAQVEIDDVT